MAGLTSTQQHTSSKRAERLYKKHMVEKRRRSRINGSLEQLKMLVLTGLNKDPEQYDKIEKADILDLTVTYLKQLTSSPARGQQAPVQPVQYSARPLTVNTHNMHQMPSYPVQAPPMHSQGIPAHQGLLQIACNNYESSYDVTSSRYDVITPQQQCRSRSLSPSSSCESSSSRSSTPSPQPAKYYSKKFQRYVDSDVESGYESTSPVSKDNMWRPW
uniref:Hairy enhancer of split 13 n=1 Tax=Platynereis dumerilii TaxID=6359 RepID=S5TRM0_PLADU|nr:hairy enhancer of split 13 [Platynereis dumerilii]